MVPEPQQRSNQIKVLIDQDRLDEATFLLRRFASELAPAEVHFLRGLIFSRRKRHDLALPEYAEAVALSQRRVAVYLFNYALQLHKTGDDDAAIATYEEVQQLEPGHFLAYNALARLYGPKYGYDRSLQLVDEALALAEQGKFGSGIFIVGQQFQPNTPHRQLAMLHFLKAAYLFALGEPEASIAAVRKSLGYFHADPLERALRDLSPEFLNSVAIDIPQWFISFVVSAHQAERAGGTWQEVLPLFSVDQWAEALPEPRREECFAIVYEAIRRAQETGDWLPAVRVAENAQESMWLMDNKEFMDRLASLPEGGAPFRPEDLVSQEAFFELTRDHP